VGAVRYTDGMADTPRRCRWFCPTPDRCLAALALVEGMLFVAQWFRWLPKGWPVLLALAAVALFLVVMAVWFVIALVFRWRFQFGVRSLLVLILVAAVPCSWLTAELQKLRRQREAFTEPCEFRSCGITVVKCIPSDFLRPPLWLTALLGDDYFLAESGISLEGIKAADNRLKLLESFTEIEFLVITDTTVSDAGLQYLAPLRELQRLELRDVDGSGITDAGLKHFEGLHQLRKLEFHHVVGNKITDAGIASLKRLTELRTLDLSETGLTDAGLKHLAGLKQLQTLTIERTHVTGIGLQHLHELRRLDSLSLWGCTITDDGLRYLKGLPISRLDLGKTPISDAGTARLTDLSQLETLQLVRTRITDSALQYIGSLSKLKYLDLTATRISGRGLRHLTGLRQLSLLYLDHTMVTEEETEVLRAALPGCTIQAY
jgi:hypothetical protein